MTDVTKLLKKNMFSCNLYSYRTIREVLHCGAVIFIYRTH